MKAVILVAILFLSAASAHSQQKLKDLLYGGKLKLDSGAVIRKDDDLSTKIDTTTKKPPVVAEPQKALVTSTVTIDPVTGNATSTPVDQPADAGAAANASNNKSWKDFMDEMIATVKTEVLPSKKIKDGTYSVLIEYTIDVEGQVSANSVSASPESSFLEQQIKERITLTAPKLTPLLGTNGKPRKAVKRQTITLTK